MCRGRASAQHGLISRARRGQHPSPPLTGHVGESGRPRELVTLEIAGSNPVVSVIFVREDLEHERQCARFVPERLWVQVPSGPPEAVDAKFTRLNARLVFATFVGSIPTASSAAVHRVTGRPVSDGCRFESGSQLQFVGVRGCSFNWQDARL